MEPSLDCCVAQASQSAGLDDIVITRETSAANHHGSWEIRSWSPDNVTGLAELRAILVEGELENSHDGEIVQTYLCRIASGCRVF